MHKGQTNIHAILQQRRLRHISGVCIRNLTVLQTEADSCNLDSVKDSLELYFVIQIAHRGHVDGRLVQSTQTLYESDSIKYCSNPTWLNFDVPKSPHSGGKKLLLQLWLKTVDGDPQALLTWNLDLSRLAYIAEQLHQEELTFSSNALVLKLCGSFYSLPQSFSSDRPHGNCPHFNLEEEKVSCNVFSLKRTITCHCSINQSKQRTSSYVASADAHMTRKNSIIERLRQIEDYRMRIKRLKLLLARETSMLKSEQSSLQSLQGDVNAKRSRLNKDRFRVLQERDRQNEITDQLVIYRQRKDVFVTQLTSRQLEVLSELAYIFPIVPYNEPNPKTAAPINKQAQPVTQISTYKICGIFLPDAENLTVKDDVKNCVALGYVSQMIYMISYFLVIPVRYTLQLQGSQSSVVDHVLDKILDKERTFPLYAKGSKDRFLFEYGVYLLNKNIAQLRFVLGIGTGDLRPMLHNLRTLLDRAFGVQQRGATAIKPPEESVNEKTAAENVSDENEPKEASEQVLNGAAKNGPVDLEDKIHDRSVELYSLRGELFGGNKKSKPIPISPRRSVLSNSTNQKPPPTRAAAQLTIPSESPAAVIWSQADMNVVTAPENKEPSAVFLTGLEDLDNQSPKISAKAKKSVDVVAARNELFSTKSGRSAYTKKHVYTIRAAGTSHADNYFSTKEQIRKSPRVTNGNADDQDSTINGGEPSTVSHEAKVPPLNLDNNNLAKVPAPLASPEEIDLC